MSIADGLLTLYLAEQLYSRASYVYAIPLESTKTPAVGVHNLTKI
jgi:hypothetical protein